MEVLSPEPKLAPLNKPIGPFGRWALVKKNNYVVVSGIVPP